VSAITHAGRRARAGSLMIALLALFAALVALGLALGL
jgi:hypothetical protein